MFSIGLRPLYNINPVGLESKCCSFTGVFRVICLVETPITTFPFRNNNMTPLGVFIYSNWSWFTKNRLNTTAWEVMRRLTPGSTSFTARCGFNSAFEGHLTNWGPSTQNEQFRFISPQNVSLSQSMCFFANCNLSSKHLFSAPTMEEHFLLAACLHMRG